MDTPLGRWTRLTEDGFLLYANLVLRKAFVHSGELEDGDAIIRELGPRIEGDIKFAHMVLSLRMR